VRRRYAPRALGAHLRTVRLEAVAGHRTERPSLVHRTVTALTDDVAAGADLPQGGSDERSNQSCKTSAARRVSHLAPSADGAAGRANVYAPRHVRHPRARQEDPLGRLSRAGVIDHV
jgi:hypothetical protein